MFAEIVCWCECECCSIDPEFDDMVMYYCDICECHLPPEWDRWDELGGG